MKIKIITYQESGKYFDRLEKGLKTNKEFQIARCTSMDYLDEYLNDSKVDILIFDENAPKEIYDKACSIKICLYSSFPDVEISGIKYIQKFCPIDELSRNIKAIYLEKHPNANQANKKRTKLVSVFSPIGGSGKTTVAIAEAYNKADHGEKVLYLNLEQFSSTVSFLNQTANNDDNLNTFLSKVSTGINMSSVLMSTTCEINGISYLLPSENIKDVLEITPELMMDIINKIVDSSMYDEVIFDMDTRLDSLTRCLLSVSDEIHLITVPGEIAYNKINMLFKDTEFRDNYLDKVILVKNKSIRGFEEYNFEKQMEIKSFVNQSRLNFDFAKQIAISMQFI